ncbi:hypothetical protein MRB53_041326 [Persea americana]|nr:hypothetical protein MRB53_041326 [Persea americana]
MKTFEAEEAEFTPEQIDEAHTKRIHDLEHMVEQYRAEVQTLQADLSQLELQPSMEAQSPKKRPRDEATDSPSDERLGELRRKSRSLQDDLDKLQQRNKLVEAELNASVAQIAHLKESSRTRVLELRNNPTAEAEHIKLRTLTTLREENAALLVQVEGKKSSGSKVVPISTLENVRQQLSEAHALTAQTEKKTLRLKQIWSAKSSNSAKQSAAFWDGVSTSNPTAA